MTGGALTIAALGQATQVAKSGAELLERAGPGGPLYELRMILGNELRLRRFSQELKIPARAQAIADEAGRPTHPIPLKFLAPLVDQAALEDEDDVDMCDRWAALLANAAIQDPDVPTYPSLPHILGQLSSVEAAVLDYLFEHTEPEGEGEWGRVRETTIKESLGEEHLPDSDLIFDNLVGLGLVTTEPLIRAVRGVSHFTDGTAVRLSGLGSRLVRACRAPAETASGPV